MKAIALLLVLFGTGAAFAQSQPQPPAGASVLNQAISAAAVTPSDSTILVPTRALFNGNATACNISVVFYTSGTAVVFDNVQAGQILPISVQQVKSTSTTCSNIVALY